MTTQARKKTTTVVAAALALGTFLAACSSGSGNSTNNSSNAGATAAGLPTPTSVASGSALKIFFINQEGASSAVSSPEAFQAASAAVTYINKKLGGLKGRPFELIHCADLGTPDSSIACANKAVDAKPAIVVKGVDTAIEAALPIISKSGIPYFTLQGSVAEGTAPNSFNPSAGIVGVLSGMVTYAKQQGVKSIGAIYSDITGLSAAVNGPLTADAKAAGIRVVPIPVAISTQDLTSAYSIALAKKVNAIFDISSVGQCAAVLKARQSLADKTPLYIPYVCDAPSVLKSSSTSVTNGMAIGSLDTSSVPSDADTKIYTAAMKAYQPSAEIGGFAPGSFEAIMDIYNALNSSSSDPRTLDAPSVSTALKSARAVPLFMGGGKTFTCDGTADPTQPGLCSGWVFILKYSDGEHSLAATTDTSAK